MPHPANRNPQAETPRPVKPAGATLPPGWVVCDDGRMVEIIRPDDSTMMGFKIEFSRVSDGFRVVGIVAVLPGMTIPEFHGLAWDRGIWTALAADGITKGTLGN